MSISSQIFSWYFDDQCSHGHHITQTCQRVLHIEISSKVTDKAYFGTLLSCRNLRRLINVILGHFRRLTREKNSFPAALFLNTWNWLAILGKFSQNVLRFKVT